MIVHLNEVPEEGLEYHITEQTGELNKDLQDIVKGQKFTVYAKIRPLNNRDYELVGTVKTRTPELCSRCGIDILFPIDKKFKEIMVPYEFQDRTSRVKSTHHVTDSDIVAEYDYSEYKHNQFSLGEFIHEVIALAVPFNVAPPENKDGNCTGCEKPAQVPVFEVTIPASVETMKSPFSALKDLKVN